MYSRAIGTVSYESRMSCFTAPCPSYSRLARSSHSRHRPCIWLQTKESVRLRQTPRQSKVAQELCEPLQRRVSACSSRPPQIAIERGLRRKQARRPSDPGIRVFQFLSYGFSREPVGNSTSAKTTQRGEPTQPLSIWHSLR